MASPAWSKVTGFVDHWVHPESPVSPGSKVGDVPDEPRQWCAFEFADLMEQGLTRGIASSFIAPPQDVCREERFCVERSPDHKEYLLTRKDGEKLLLARKNNNGGGFGIFVARDGQPPSAFGPAFELTPNKTEDRWMLYCETCDTCEARGRRKCGKRELAYITHFTEEVGEGKICCMDLEVPEVHQDGSSASWCPVCTSAMGTEDNGSMTLTTRRPKWNARRQTLSLDFYGRCSVASAKNFQLQFADKPGQIKLLFGKVSAHSFVLDFRSPLSTVQAFAAAVSTSGWK